MHVCELSLFSHVWLCDPINCSPPGFSAHGILQARILERVAMLSSRRSHQPRDWTRVSCVSCIGRWVPYHDGHLGSPHRVRQCFPKHAIYTPQAHKIILLIFECFTSYIFLTFWYLYIFNTHQEINHPAEQRLTLTDVITYNKVKRFTSGSNLQSLKLLFWM